MIIDELCVIEPGGCIHAPMTQGAQPIGPKCLGQHRYRVSPWTNQALARPHDVVIQSSALDYTSMVDIQRSCLPGQRGSLAFTVSTSSVSKVWGPHKYFHRWSLPCWPFTKRPCIEGLVEHTFSVLQAQRTCQMANRTLYKGLATSVILLVVICLSVIRNNGEENSSLEVKNDMTLVRSHNGRVTDNYTQYFGRHTYGRRGRTLLSENTAEVSRKRNANS